MFGVAFVVVATWMAMGALVASTHSLVTARRLQGVADVTALAAAGHGDAMAERVAVANSASLVRIESVDDAEIPTIRVRVTMNGRVATAHAALVEGD